MKKTLDEWMKGVAATKNGVRKVYYTASCPIYGQSQSADGDTGRHVVVGKIWTHIGNSHGDLVIFEVNKG